MAEETKKTRSTASETDPVPAPTVSFTPEQMAVIERMIERRASYNGQEVSSARPQGISMYNLRDPKKIEAVMMSRFDAKWVVGFKNLQKDPYKKTPSYLRYGPEPIRKLPNEPYITLLLSEDGKKIEEKEVLLLDYMENREKIEVPVVDIKVKEVIHDHGVLGSSGEYAGAVDIDPKTGRNVNVKPQTILQQSKTEDRTFIVQVPDFAEPLSIIADFLG